MIYRTSYVMKIRIENICKEFGVVPNILSTRFQNGKIEANKLSVYRFVHWTGKKKVRAYRRWRLLKKRQGDAKLVVAALSRWNSGTASWWARYLNRI